jgi:hypothetical protein
MEMDIEEDEEVTTDPALFGEEAVERGLHTKPTVPALQQPTPIPATTTSNAGEQQDISITNNKASTSTATTINLNIDSTLTASLNTSPKQLCNSGGWDLTRWSTKSFPRQLEKDYNPVMATVSNSKRLSITIYKETIPMENQKGAPLTNGSTGDRCTNRKISQSRNYSQITNAEQRLSIEFLYHTRANEASANSRLHNTQQISANSTLQDGRNSSIEGFDRTRRL